MIVDGVIQFQYAIQRENISICNFGLVSPFPKTGLFHTSKEIELTIPHVYNFICGLEAERYL